MFVRIRFYDHVMNGNKPLLCEVVGRLEKEDDLSIQVISWDVLEEDRETIECNRDSFIILKSTIVEQEQLLGQETGKKQRKARKTKKKGDS